MNYLHNNENPLNSFFRRAIAIAARKYRQNNEFENFLKITNTALLHELEEADEALYSALMAFINSKADPKGAFRSLCRYTSDALINDYRTYDEYRKNLNATKQRKLDALIAKIPVHEIGTIDTKDPRFNKIVDCIDLGTIIKGYSPLARLQRVLMLQHVIKSADSDVELINSIFGPAYDPTNHEDREEEVNESRAADESVESSERSSYSSEDEHKSRAADESELRNMQEINDRFGPAYDPTNHGDIDEESTPTDESVESNDNSSSSSEASSRNWNNPSDHENIRAESSSKRLENRRGGIHNQVLKRKLENNNNDGSSESKEGGRKKRNPFGGQLHQRNEDKNSSPDSSLLGDGRDDDENSSFRQQAKRLQAVIQKAKTDKEKHNEPFVRTNDCKSNRSKSWPTLNISTA